MFPTAQAARSMGSLQDVRDFYQLDDAVWRAFVAQAGDPGTDQRLLASLPPSAIAAACEVASLDDGTPLTAIQAAHVGLVYRLCRRLLHLREGGNWDTWEDADPWQAQPPTSSPTRATSPTSMGSTPERKLKISTVIDQGDDSEFQVLPETMRAAWYQKFLDVMGGPPEEDCEPTGEQLSALHRKIFEHKAAPYADFGIFVPYGRKQLRSSKFKALTLTAQGYAMKEIPGPANYLAWRASFRVFKTAMIMMDVVSVANLMGYEAFIERLAQTYPSAWHLVVVAEDNARAEHLTRLRTRLTTALSAGGAPPMRWDPRRPWDYLFTMLMEDERYWRDQVHTPAIAWMASGARGTPRSPAEKLALNYMKDGLEAAGQPVEKRGRSNSRSGKRKKRKNFSDKEENTPRGSFGGSQGGGSKSKGKGKGGKSPQLCYAWNDNTGSCAGLSAGAECKAPVKREHRCTKCKSPGHPAYECPTKKQ